MNENEIFTCLFGKRHQQQAAGTGLFGLAISVWGNFDPNTSVHKQLNPFVYLNDYIGRRNVTLAGVLNQLPFEES